MMRIRWVKIQVAVEAFTVERVFYFETIRELAKFLRYAADNKWNILGHGVDRCIKADDALAETKEDIDKQKPR